MKQIFTVAAAMILAVGLQAKPRNVAQSATITASGQYSAAYNPKYVADGKIPEPGSHANADAAWCC